MPCGVGSSGAGRAIGTKVSTGVCGTHAAGATRSGVVTIDRRCILLFPPTGVRGGSLTTARGRAFGQMPHMKLRDGGELYYEKQGSGPPLFLVPGLGGDGRFWDVHAREL